ncbi:MAG: hypothetical protein EA375_02700 [Acholeplasmataceae bacterium]|nr:MAG: hypothetical protein EA375_02700 [Acholeplasmataceae bacterium]
MKSFKIVLTLMVLFSAIVALVACTDEVSAHDAYVTLDINPSIELVVTPREKVIYANPLNEDAEMLLLGLDLVGMDLDDAIDLIITEAINLGFIDVDAEEVTIAVTSIAEQAELGNIIRERVKAIINQAFMNRAMMGRAEDKGFVPDFVAEAESYGVTPGFLFLARQVTEMDDEISLEEALDMTVDELNAILRTRATEHKAVAHALRDQFLAERDAVLAEYQDLIQALLEQLETAEPEDQPAILAELADLRADLLDALGNLRDEFLAQSEALRLEMHGMRQQRIEAHRQDVEDFLDEMEQRRQEMQDRINDFQHGRPRP